MSKWSYTRGLHDLGNSVYAYLQPDGTWGWSNSGIVIDGEVSLLIDTLFDLKLTRDMLDTMRNSIPSAAHIDMVVNTHANGIIVGEMNCLLMHRLSRRRSLQKR